MKKYNLTDEEKAVVNKFCKYSIPFIFKSGEYCGYMQHFELVNFEICSALLEGKRIDEKDYQMIMSQGVDIIKEKLDNYALEFFNLYVVFTSKYIDFPYKNLQLHNFCRGNYVYFVVFLSM